MIRRILMDIILFLLPFFLYSIYWRVVLRSGKARENAVYPWVFLTASGLGLVILSFLWWAATGGGPTEGVYIPPHLEDGEMVPGQFQPAPPQ